MVTAGRLGKKSKGEGGKPKDGAVVSNVRQARGNIIPRYIAHFIHVNRKMSSNPAVRRLPRRLYCRSGTEHSTTCLMFSRFEWQANYCFDRA